MGYRRPASDETAWRYNRIFYALLTHKELLQFVESIHEGIQPRMSGTQVDAYYDNLKSGKVRRLVQAGITMVQPGIEHFSTKILALMEKFLVGIENVAFLKYAREYGLHPAYNVLLELGRNGGADNSQDEVIISFSEEDFVQDPDLSVKPLVDAGLILEEEGRFLALPVYKHHLKTDETWQTFYI